MELNLTIYLAISFNFDIISSAPQFVREVHCSLPLSAKKSKRSLVEPCGILRIS